MAVQTMVLEKRIHLSGKLFSGSAGWNSQEQEKGDQTDAWVHEGKVIQPCGMTTPLRQR